MRASDARFVALGAAGCTPSASFEVAATSPSKRNVSGDARADALAREATAYGGPQDRSRT